jgi:hypothetical protein
MVEMEETERGGKGTYAKKEQVEKAIVCYRRGKGNSERCKGG